MDLTEITRVLPSLLLPNEYLQEVIWDGNVEVETLDEEPFIMLVKGEESCTVVTLIVVVVDDRIATVEKTYAVELFEGTYSLKRIAHRWI